MEVKDLIEYLRYVVDVEKNIHSIDCSVETLTNDKKYLGRPRYEPPKPFEPKKPSLEKKKHWIHYLLGGILLIALAAAIGLSGPILFLSIWPLLFGVGCLATVLGTTNENRKIQKANDRLYLEYENEMDKYNAALSARLEEKERDAIRIKNELNKIQLIDHMIDKLISQRKKVKLYLISYIHTTSFIQNIETSLLSAPSSIISLPAYVTLSSPLKTVLVVLTIFLKTKCSINRL